MRERTHGIVINPPARLITAWSLLSENRPVSDKSWTGVIFFSFYGGVEPKFKIRLDDVQIEEKTGSSILAVKIVTRGKTATMSTWKKLPAQWGEEVAKIAASEEAGFVDKFQPPQCKAKAVKNAQFDGVNEVGGDKLIWSGVGNWAPWDPCRLQV